MALTSKQRSALKAQAHALKPVVSVGQKGITEALVAETERALVAHELIKVRFHEADDLDEGVVALANDASAECVGVVGKNAIFFRRNPDRPKVTLPASS